MTREIVKSDTDHATTLTAAIRSSHQALLNQRCAADAEQRHADAERRLAEVEKRLANIEQKQHACDSPDDPPDKKEASSGKGET